MKIGVRFPQEALIHDTHLIRDFVQAADGLGYDRLLVFEHVLGAERANRHPPLPQAYDENAPFHDALVFLGFVAGMTSSIELATGVIVSPQRQTALLAKQAAEVAILSDNRLMLGLGVGWNWVEYQGMGVSFARRGDRQEEQIKVLRQLWSESVVEYRGEFHDIERAGIAPRPTRRIPIWLGGFSEPVFHRAVRMADGLITLAGSGISNKTMTFDAHRTVSRIRDLLSNAGRDQSTFGIDVIVTEMATPDEFAARVEEYRDDGVTHLTLQLTGLSSDPHQYTSLLERFMVAFRG